jgi:hypothetical protein
MYLEAMEEIMPGIRLIVADPNDGILRMLDLNSGNTADSNTNANIGTGGGNGE